MQLAYQVYLQPRGDSMLQHSIVTGVDVALAHLVALENHGRFVVVKVFFKATVHVVPRLDTQVGAITRVLGRTLVRAVTVLKKWKPTHNVKSDSKLLFF